MLARGRKYHAWLVAQAEAVDAYDLWFAMRRFRGPWFILIVIGALACSAPGLDETVGIVVMAPFMIVSLGGMVHAAGVVLIYGLRSDLRRLKAAPDKDGS